MNLKDYESFYNIYKNNIENVEYTFFDKIRFVKMFEESSNIYLKNRDGSNNECTLIKFPIYGDHKGNHYKELRALVEVKGREYDIRETPIYYIDFKI